MGKKKALVCTKLTAKTQWAKKKKKKGQNTEWIQMKDKGINSVSVFSSDTFKGVHIHTSPGPLVISSKKVSPIVPYVHEEIMHSSGEHYVLRARCVPLVPSEEQSKLLLQMMEDATLVYNAARHHPFFVDAHKQALKGEKLPRGLFRSLSKDIVTKNNIVSDELLFVCRTPFHVRDNAVKDAVANLKVFFLLCGQGF